MQTGADFAKKYLTSIGLLICLVVLSVFWGFYYRSTELIETQLLHQGQSFFQEIVLTRQWAASHNGVYVRLEPGVEPNPYLRKIPGLKVMIRDESGQPYVLKNPALITREISELATQKGLFRFHITSLNPLNPANAPDPFETDALHKFAAGAKESSGYESRDGEVYFRYMAPLVTEKSCLVCHAQQGYKEGDVRGGISVTSSATETAGKIKESRLFLILAAILIVSLILAIIYLVARSFINDLRTAETKLVEMATQDFLTGLLNRRETFRRLDGELQRSRRLSVPFSVLLLDFDHFKQVNDVHGHSAGDLVLQTVASVLRKGVRPYDLCCRHGGEEFLVVLPETALTEAAGIAERLRSDIEQQAISLPDGQTLRVTASIGAAALAGDETIDQLIIRADEAMYQAKQSGRNRVCLAGPPGSP